jgi:hypothetical protein
MLSKVLSGNNKQMKLDKTQMIALGIALLVILYAMSQVSGYIQSQDMNQDASDVSLQQYNSQVEEYNKTWSTWLQEIISK